MIKGQDMEYVYPKLFIGGPLLIVGSCLMISAASLRVEDTGWALSILQEQGNPN